jgi:hypothetical protein
MAIGLAGAAASGRAPIATDVIKTFVNTSAQATTHGLSHPRFSLPANDPAFFPTAQPQNVLQGRAGARYGIRVRMPIPVSPEAGATQANGRVVRGRGTSGSFWGAQA